MSSTTQYIPIYKQFIDLIEAGFGMLDEASQLEIQQFVGSCQHADGSFVNRGGDSDLYYSLFGFWLSFALKLGGQLEQLKYFVLNEENGKQKNTVDEFALRLIQIGLTTAKPPRIFLLKNLISGKHQTNFSYQLFLFLLVFDARHGRKVWLYFFVRLWLRFYNTPANSPCSVLAALMVARHEVGMNTKESQKQLFSYFDEKSGFRAFEHLESGDLLSTSVALFALQKVDLDLRLIAPACFDFIQSNYEQGAFLSGDGDETRDLEYTFYGLLALGCLAASQKHQGRISRKKPS